MENRCRILAAAARVYAALGFRGATTRRIADEAGVNEVTLFRTFGSKEALIAEALRQHAASQPAAHHLPGEPVDPERELLAWAEAQLAELRASRSLIRKALGEAEERPEMAPCVAAGWTAADLELRRYLQRLGERGLVDWAHATADAPAGGGARAALERADAAAESIAAAGAMLMAALFSDAIGRDTMPDMFPQPADRAPALYVRLFLRAVGCRALADATDAPAATGAVRSRVSGRRQASSLPITSDP